jgi:hypothetical protein
MKKLKIGAFGHSLGGATAFGGMLREQKIEAGMNMDGYFVNSTTIPDAVKDAGKDRAFMVLGVTNHTSATEPTWQPWKAAQTGWVKEWEMKGGGHLVYGDFGAVVDLLGIREELPDWFLEYYLGSIGGLRAVEVQRMWARDFFEWKLRAGKGRIVRGGGDEKWPEMAVVK